MFVKNVNERGDLGKDEHFGNRKCRQFLNRKMKMP